MVSQHTGRFRLEVGTFEDNQWRVWIIEKQQGDSASTTALRRFAIDLINSERGKRGLTPVELGTNSAAQSHAEDMLGHRYIGHWWLNGKKPYMVYTEVGAILTFRKMWRHQGGISESCKKTTARVRK